MIALQKEQENLPKNQFFVSKSGMKLVYACLRDGIENWPPFSTSVQLFSINSGYTEVLHGGTISLPTGRHIDNR